MSPLSPSRLGPSRLGVALAILVALPALTASVALAEDAAAATEKPGPGQVLAIVLLVLLFAIGIGCLIGLLRVILPGPARKADVALRRLSTGRLLLTGLLPTVGVLLLAGAAGATHIQPLAIAAGILLVLPAALLMLFGALAAIPHLGGALLKGGEDRSLLARSVVGAVTLGLALGATAPLPPLAFVMAMLVAGWFLGAGLGVIFKPAAPAENVSEA